MGRHSPRTQYPPLHIVCWWLILKSAEQHVSPSGLHSQPSTSVQLEVHAPNPWLSPSHSSPSSLLTTPSPQF